MRRIAFTVAYDGTNYVGWQRQDNGLSVQEVLEGVIARLFGETVHVMGSGRTDAGVHARGQVAAMELEHPIPCENLLRAMNSNLPDDIRIFDMWEAAGDFHPRFQAKEKTYHYQMILGPVMPPECRLNHVLVSEALDIDAMRRALADFVGEHDYYAFRSSGGENLTTVRTVYAAELILNDEAAGDGWKELTLSVTGNGFLYHMVRLLAGTLLEIGKGKLPEDTIRKALETGDKELVGPTAPAKGLTLWQVVYAE